MEHEIRPLIELMMPANGLDVVTIEHAATQPAVQLGHQLFLAERVEPIHILRLQRGRLGVLVALNQPRGISSPRMMSSKVCRLRTEWGLPFSMSTSATSGFEL